MWVAPTVWHFESGKSYKNSNKGILLYVHSSASHYIVGFAFIEIRDELFTSAHEPIVIYGQMVVCRIEQINVMRSTSDDPNHTQTHTDTHLHIFWTENNTAI